MILAVDRGLETQSFAMLWLVAYTFLLCVPSEALPIVRVRGLAYCLPRPCLLLICILPA